MTDFGEKTYVSLNEQVTLQNQDPVDISAGLKSSLIDLEAEVLEPVTRGKRKQPDRLNEKTQKWDVIVRTGFDKIQREIRRDFSAVFNLEMYHFSIQFDN